jgi:Ca2+/Na+ antiporter
VSSRIVGIALILIAICIVLVLVLQSKPLRITSLVVALVITIYMIVTMRKAAK